jgi:hypothetical protein
MNQLSKCPVDRSPLRGWRFAILAALAWCGGFAVPSSGSAGGGNGETVGTLPDTGGGQGAAFDISRTFRDASPALYLEGRLDDISAIVLGWNGRAVITEEIMDASTHVVRLTFHGNFSIDLDRHAFQRGAVQVGWSVPRAFGPARATLLLGGRTIAAGLVEARSLTLPVLEIDSTGGLETTALSIVTSGRHGRASLDITASGDDLILTQQH